MTTAPSPARPARPRPPLSRLVLGTMTFGDTVDPTRRRACSTRRSTPGSPSIDTANGYAGGATEKMLGELLPGRRDRRRSPPRPGSHPDAGDAPLLSAAACAPRRGSLRRLGIDHVDLFYLHQPDRAVAAGRDPRCPRPSSSPRARSAPSASPTSPPGRSPTSSTAADAARRTPARSSPSSSTTSSPAGSRRSTSSSPTSPVWRPWSTTRSAAACSPAGTASTETPARAASATPRSPPCTPSGTGTRAVRASSRPSPPSRDEAGIPLTELSLRWLLSSRSSPRCCSAAPSSPAGGQHRRRASRSAARRRRRRLRRGRPGLRGPMPAYNR